MDLPNINYSKPEPPNNKGVGIRIYMNLYFNGLIGINMAMFVTNSLTGYFPKHKRSPKKVFNKWQFIRGFELLNFVN